MGPVISTVLHNMSSPSWESSSPPSQSESGDFKKKSPELKELKVVVKIFIVVLIAHHSCRPLFSSPSAFFFLLCQHGVSIPSAS